MDEKKRKDLIFLICQCIVAVIGAAIIIVKDNTILLSAYIPLMALIIPAIYFNYSLSKLGNKWYSLWHERYPSDGEPSDFRLLMGKICGWGRSSLRSFWRCCPGDCPDGKKVRRRSAAH